MPFGPSCYAVMRREDFETATLQGIFNNPRAARSFVQHCISETEPGGPAWEETVGKDEWRRDTVLLSVQSLRIYRTAKELIKDINDEIEQGVQNSNQWTAEQQQQEQP